MSPQRAVGEQELKGPRGHGNSRSFLKEVGGTLTQFLQGGSPRHLSRGGLGAGGTLPTFSHHLTFLDVFQNWKVQVPVIFLVFKGNPIFI